jgi:hypothetical protein
MSESFGSGPSRVLDPADLAYQLTVFMSGNPPTDAEVNYIGQINNEERRKLIKSMMPSGIIGDPNRAHLDFHSHVSYSNYFYMGRQLEVETATTSTHTTGLKHILWANVDGWIIPVTGTQVNESVLVDDDYRNKIVLPFGPSSDFNTNFVFLEVWKALIERTPSATNKPTANTIYKFGNVEFGGTNPTEDLTAPDIVSETTKSEPQRGRGGDAGWFTRHLVPAAGCERRPGSVARRKRQRQQRPRHRGRLRLRHPALRCAA